MQDTIIVGEVEAGEAAKVRKSLEKAIKQVNVSTFDVAVLLHKVHAQHLYTTSTFAEYVATLDIKSSRAQYLERIAEVMKAINCPREEWEKVGVTKLRVISRLDPTATYTNPQTNETSPMTDYIWGLIELAPTVKADKLEQDVRILKGEVGGNDMTWLNVRLPRLVMDNTVTPAFEKAATNIGTVKTNADGMAQDASIWRKLEVVCVDYLLDPQSDPEVG